MSTEATGERRPEFRDDYALGESRHGFAAERLASAVNEAEPARLVAAALALGPPKATP